MRGQKRTVTPEWCARVSAELTRRGKTQQWLEQQIGAGQGSLTAVLHRGIGSSALVDPICKALAIDLPISLPTLEAEYVILLRRASDEGKAAVMQMLRALVQKN